MLTDRSELTSLIEHFKLADFTMEIINTKNAHPRVACAQLPSVALQSEVDERFYLAKVSDSDLIYLFNYILYPTPPALSHTETIQGDYYVIVARNNDAAADSNVYKPDGKININAFTITGGFFVGITPFNNIRIDGTARLFFARTDKEPIPNGSKIVKELFTRFAHQLCHDENYPTVVRVLSNLDSISPSAVVKYPEYYLHEGYFPKKQKLLAENATRKAAITQKVLALKIDEKNVEESTLENFRTSIADPELHVTAQLIPWVETVANRLISLFDPVFFHSLRYEDTFKSLLAEKGLAVWRSLAQAADSPQFQHGVNRLRHERVLVRKSFETLLRYPQADTLLYVEALAAIKKVQDTTMNVMLTSDAWFLIEAQLANNENDFFSSILSLENYRILNPLYLEVLILMRKYLPNEFSLLDITATLIYLHENQLTSTLRIMHKTENDRATELRSSKDPAYFRLLTYLLKIERLTVNRINAISLASSSDYEEIERAIKTLRSRGYTLTDAIFDKLLSHPTPVAAANALVKLAEANITDVPKWLALLNAVNCDNIARAMITLERASLYEARSAIVFKHRDPADAALAVLRLSLTEIDRSPGIISATLNQAEPAAFANILSTLEMATALNEDALTLLATEKFGFFANILIYLNKHKPVLLTKATIDTLTRYFSLFLNIKTQRDLVTNFQFIPLRRLTPAIFTLFFDRHPYAENIVAFAKACDLKTDFNDENESLITTADITNPYLPKLITLLCDFHLMSDKVFATLISKSQYSSPLLFDVLQTMHTHHEALLKIEANLTDLIELSKEIQTLATTNAPLIPLLASLATPQLLDQNNFELLMRMMDEEDDTHLVDALTTLQTCMSNLSDTTSTLSAADVSAVLASADFARNKALLFEYHQKLPDAFLAQMAAFSSNLQEDFKNLPEGAQTIKRDEYISRHQLPPVLHIAAAFISTELMTSFCTPNSYEAEFIKTIAAIEEMVAGKINPDPTPEAIFTTEEILGMPPTECISGDKRGKKI